MSIGYLPWNQPAAVVDRACVRDGSVELTYGEVATRVDAVAEQFAALGVGRGDVVAVMLPNRVELLLGLMAAWRLGAAATPINPVFTANEAGYQLQDSGAVLLLTSKPDADYGVPVVLADELNTRPAGTLPAPAVAPADLALLIYTSGSTGRPKGVMLDHANLVAMGSSIGEWFQLGPHDHCLLVLPLFHVNAILVSCLAPMMSARRSRSWPGSTRTPSSAPSSATGPPTSPPCRPSTRASPSCPSKRCGTPRRCGSRCAARPRCPRSCCSAASRGSASRSSRGTA